MIAYTVANVPKWNPINVCSYHLQEAGATPVQEVAFALCTAIAVLDSVRDSGQVPEDKFGEVVARISFFVNAGVRFIEEMCKLRAFGQLWDEITAIPLRRGGSEAPAVPVRRAGELARADRGAAGEQRLPHPARDARGDDVARRAGACRPAAGVERGARACRGAWDQQWSLRMQQVLAFESDLLEYDDIFAGSKVVEAKVAAIKDGAREEIDRILEMGGAVEAVESGYLKSALVSSLALRRRRIESGEDVVVGVNKYTETEPNPLMGGEDGGILTVDKAVEESAKDAIRRGARAATRRPSTTR